MRALLLLFLVLSQAAVATERPRARPPQERCAADGSACIRLDSYTDDVCREIEGAADSADIDPGWFARLLWQESLFDAAAVSPAGAQGIAQFMPGTADLRGLKDPFNPVDAIRASADYLADLTRMYGNEGLAAAAYNAGEARAADFVADDRPLPGETRAYVQIITGHPARSWRDSPPEDVDYALAPDTQFGEACRAQAATRTFKSFAPAVPPPPEWGVIVAAGRRRATVENFVDKVRRENGGVIGTRRIEIVEKTLPGFASRARLSALIVTADGAEARALCRQLQARSAFCRVTGPGT
ncbi:lytic transglycosylase domain-containing protein [Palleronia abyssalis]|uniref:Membrane-bound lytic murein transglycosylase F n=1 Tax=Palleronia abyssalis TaxID=1501240 RepID=A0A2R8BQL7_9RHOB|nr:lytic transglycosylase domain-containing protein [Palleronia abyssalis]SPJ22449.1 Membrane-bound lytic murein transglycosylase F [Palleronia abyssalis]